jgi:hypothetical protein
VRLRIPDRAIARTLIALGTVVLAAVVGCTEKTPFAGLAEARRLAAELQVEFTRAADAGNRAVMADTDEASVAYAREARTAADAVQKKADALGAVLNEFGFSQEADQLEEFRTNLAEYRALDRTILDLAVENTNLKAQRLSFGEARAAADALRDAVTAVAPANQARDLWRVRALGATAVASVREIQALQAPHIAEADEAAMRSLEKQMAADEAGARRALSDLDGLARPGSRPQLAAATAQLSRFMQLNAEIVMLSRRNTNVRSLALSLNQKRALTATCEASLQTLRESLDKRSFAGTR